MLQLAGAIGSVILLIALGVLVRRVGLLGPEQIDILNRIIIYLALPALIFLGIYRAQLSASLLVITLIGWLTILIGFALALAVARALRLTGSMLGAFLLVATLGNTGYLGYPLTIALFGTARLVDAFFYDIFATSIALLTLGVAVARHFGRAETEMAGEDSFVGSVTFPALVAVGAGLVLKLVPIPAFVLTAVGHVADLTVPLVMLTIGMSIEVQGFRDHPAALGAVALLKLLLAPATALALWLGMSRLGLVVPAGAASTSESVTRAVVVLEASMPSMMLTYVIGLRYRLRAEFIASAIVATTLLALLTVPVWQLALRSLG